MKRVKVFLVLLCSFLVVSYAEPEPDDPSNYDLQLQLDALEWIIINVNELQWEIYDMIANNHAELMAILENLSGGGTADLTAVEDLLSSILNLQQNFVLNYGPKFDDMHLDLGTVKYYLEQQSFWNDEFKSAFDSAMVNLEGSILHLSTYLSVISVELQMLTETVENGFNDVFTLLEDINNNLEDLPYILTTLTEIKDAQSAYFDSFDSFVTSFTLKMDLFEAIFLRLEILLQDVNANLSLYGEEINSILLDILEKDWSIETKLQSLLDIQSEISEDLAPLSSSLASILDAIENLSITFEGDIDFPDYSDEIAFIKNTQQFITDYTSAIDATLRSFFTSYEEDQTALKAHHESLLNHLATILSQARTMTGSIGRFKDAFDAYVEGNQSFKEKVEGLIDTEERVSPGELDADVYDEYEVEIENEIEEQAHNPTPELADITGEVEDEIAAVTNRLAAFEVTVEELVASSLEKIEFELGEFSSSFRYAMDFPLDSGGTYEAVFEVDFRDEPFSTYGNAFRKIAVFVWTVVAAIYAYRSSMNHLLAIVSN